MSRRLTTRQKPPQIPPRKTSRIPRQFFRRPHPHNSPATRPAFRPHVDQPVGGFDDVQVVLDDDDGVARVAQLVQHFGQQRDVGKVQAGSGFVQDVSPPPSAPKSARYSCTCIGLRAFCACSVGRRTRRRAHFLGTLACRPLRALKLQNSTRLNCPEHVPYLAACDWISSLDIWINWIWTPKKSVNKKARRFGGPSKRGSCSPALGRYAQAQIAYRSTVSVRADRF